MPKKTRQEKILAQLRRLQEQNSTPQLNLEKTPSLQSKPEKTVENTPVSIKTEALDYKYVFSDLKKTVIFAICAIAFEVILSLTAYSSYAKLFFRLF